MIILDEMNNMNDFEIEDNLIYCQKKCLPLPSANECIQRVSCNKNGTVDNWIKIDNVISKLQKCDSCLTLNKLVFDNNGDDRLEKSASFAKNTSQKNGFINSATKDETKLKVETIIENTSSELVSKHDLASSDADKYVNKKCFDTEPNDGENAYIDDIESGRQKRDSASVGINVCELSNSESFRDHLEDGTINISDTCISAAVLRDSHDCISDLSSLDINNPNLFSDFEDSDDEVFEIEPKKSYELSFCKNFVINKANKPPHTLSESAILNESSHRIDKPLQTVSDSAIVTALNKTSKRSVQTSGRKKSVHFAIFPYIIEIPRVADLEEEFYEAELERYGKAHCSNNILDGVNIFDMFIF